MTTALRLTLCVALGLAACAAPTHTSIPKQTATPPAVNGSLPAGFGLQPVSYRPASRGAPIALTTSDGNALKLLSVDARSVVEGPLTFTELRLAFENPEPRRIEGRFRVVLPQRATVSRFAMKIAGEWQEAEMVERKRARRIYEDFLHRRVDPALLEQGAGNAFTARVFPIEPRSTKELILSYSQEIVETRETLVPLQGLPKLAQLSVSVSGAGGVGPTHKLTHANYQPTADFSVERSALVAGGLRHGNLVVARVAPMASAEPAALGSALVLVDTSASRALELGAQLALLRQLATRMAAAGSADAKLVVGTFDQEIELVYQGPPSGFGSQHVERIAKRRALGASDLARALRWAGGVASAQQLERLLLLTDGVVTAGRDGNKLQKTARALKRKGVQRIDAIAYGGIRDGDALKAIVTAGLAQDGVVADGRAPAATIWRRLTLVTRSGIAVKVKDARWWWPRVINGAQPGDEVLVYADVPGSSAVDISLAGRAVSGLALRRAQRPLLERSWARAKVASLLDRERRKGATSTTQKKIVELSTRHRVLSPYTALLVLETQRDYDRYGLARDALADILTVNHGRLQVLQRNAPPARKARRVAVSRRDASQQPWGRDDSLGTDPLSARGHMWGDAIGDSFGAGGLGLSGVGEGGGGRGEGVGLGDAGTIGRGAGSRSNPTQAPPPTPAPAPAATGSGQGFGSGSGRLGRSHRARPPRVRMGQTMVSGRLPPEIIQRIVRQNFGRFRACYQQALLSNPQLAGRVSVRFVIGRDGSVANSSATGDLPNAGVISCVSRAFYGLNFPQPEGGIVTVSYPIVFSPDGSQPPPQPQQRSSRSTPRPPPAAAPPPVRRAARPAVARPYRGQLASIMDAIGGGRAADALSDAQAWHADSPGDILALIALGEALEAAGKARWAARAYGSIIDLFPTRADLRRYAGERLERLKRKDALRLAIDTYRKAKEQRPDHPTGYRLLAFAQLKAGQHESAFESLQAGMKATGSARSNAAWGVLRADLGLVAAAWLKAKPSKRSKITQQLNAAGGKLASRPSLRFVLNWETDTNDVDLHIYDRNGDHASYESPRLRSGGRLHLDVTSGYGPELFEIEGASRSSGYLLQAHYYSRGPMGFGMGKVQIIEHDGKGGLTFEERPFLVMVDRAYVDLGTFGDWQPAKG